MNCHSAGDRPLQGEAMVPHQPPVVRGEGGMGAPGMFCTTCHGAQNVAFVGAEGSIPGHEAWHLAPIEMAWEVRSLGEICAQIKDHARNGGKSMAELHEHNAHDGLVGWAGTPAKAASRRPATRRPSAR